MRLGSGGVTKPMRISTEPTVMPSPRSISIHCGGPLAALRTVTERATRRGRDQRVGIPVRGVNVLHILAVDGDEVTRRETVDPVEIIPPLVNAVNDELRRLSERLERMRYGIQPGSFDACSIQPATRSWSSWSSSWMSR